jgi:hypothetical protein
MRTDEATDMTKLLAAFPNIANEPETSQSRNVFLSQILDLGTFIKTQQDVCTCVIYTCFSAPFRYFCESVIIRS